MLGLTTQEGIYSPSLLLYTHLHFAFPLPLRPLLFCFLEIRHFAGLQLQLELVGNQSYKLRIGGLSLGIADGVAEKPLQGVQVPSVPGHFNGVADGPFDTGWGGAEGFGYLGVEHLGDGIGVPCGPPEGVLRTATKQEIFQSSLLLSLLVNAPMLHWVYKINTK